MANLLPLSWQQGTARTFASPLYVYSGAIRILRLACGGEERWTRDNIITDGSMFSQALPVGIVDTATQPTKQ